jgi:hypothetical protein
LEKSEKCGAKRCSRSCSETTVPIAALAATENAIARASSLQSTSSPLWARVWMRLEKSGAIRGSWKDMTTSGFITLVSACLHFRASLSGKLHSVGNTSRAVESAVTWKLSHLHRRREGSGICLPQEQNNRPARQGNDCDKYSSS